MFNLKKILCFFLAVICLFSVCSAHEVFTEEQMYTDYELSSLTTKARSGMADYIGIIVSYAEEYNINPLYLMAKFGLESGWCTSEYFKKYNNIGGWMKYDSTPMVFDSVEDCVGHIVKGIAEYNNPLSWKYTGNNLEKVCYRYCQDEGYYEIILSIMDELQSEIDEFRIKNDIIMY